jgi:hypothetical protein
MLKKINLDEIYWHSLVELMEKSASQIIGVRTRNLMCVYMLELRIYGDGAELSVKLESFFLI